MKNTKNSGHIIKDVAAGSIADELEIESGDVLLAINNYVINDVFDYRYYCNDEYLDVLIRKPDGEEWLLEIEKEYDEELGIEFENSLMSEYKSCSNKCIFCFIDQMPPGMRKTLYFKDDDSRLSFLQGNYITLTNMNDDDIQRIIEMKLAPINISVHTTNPQLRCTMTNNRFAGDKLKYLKLLYDNHIEMNGQIVLCKGVNDGAELEKTIDDLSKLMPFMKSVSIVPAGITKYRDGLYPLELFDGAESGDIIDVIESRQKEFYDRYNLHFIHASDEWYINAGRDFPKEETYDGYIQIENGVGMMRLLIDETEDKLMTLSGSDSDRNRKKDIKRTVTIATGVLAYDTIRILAAKVTNMYDNIHVNVVKIYNHFFGETITVTGLITGQDLVEQLKEYGKNNSFGDAILITSCMLRAGERVFLDDMTVDEAVDALGVDITIVGSSGGDFVESIINPEYGMDNNFYDMI
ncbi:MAG: DUF512 domain-containing protein [Lachnospiraceae bacterium]|nr:DUF512 domain-containing protein [Lachnospiraceae bacterium]